MQTKANLTLYLKTLFARNISLHKALRQTSQKRCEFFSGNSQTNSANPEIIENCRFNDHGAD